jgi:hypothetical protein
MVWATFFHKRIWSPCYEGVLFAFLRQSLRGTRLVHGKTFASPKRWSEKATKNTLKQGQVL